MLTLAVVGLCAFAAAGGAQERTPGSLLPFARDGRMGFADPKGKVVIEPQFDEAGFFSEGFAQVKVKSKWGYIDKSGAFLWEPSK